ncbi:GNAT family N-acetyltransferase [Hymenobacter glacieicola]|uniref:Phosphinothricin N-acetyltransferase n=1 Tax=Hymenobacter glacieicola TaxID=1562124 RepID=A0ABQ1WNB7_9BACT|nr:GNAT family N-acetyltransferase [Hymenobacter glacieicola]GGG34660.1 phosphinothricin N-acetyltransferase [Hymenobacter glacieicola]
MPTTATLQLLPLAQEHYPAVSAIYAEGIATGQATFATEIPAWAEWDASHLPHSRFVALTGAGQVAGWAALTPVSGRCVYRGVAEVSVYVGAAHRGRGVGQQLLAYLVAESEQHGIWTLQASIMRLNTGSLRLHEQAGFRLVGVRERLGELRGQWHDVCMLERRSKVVG